MSDVGHKHAVIEDQAAAYALGACEADAAAEVRAHLRGCASCAELVDRLSTAAAVLPLAADEVRPPERLRQRILDAAAGSARSAGAPPAPGNIVRLPRRSRDWSRWRSQWPAAAVAVLALAVIGLGGWDVALSRQLNAAQAAHYDIQGTGPMQGSEARVVAFRRDNVTVIDFRHMPALQSGKVYQVWLIDGAGNPTSAGVFQPEADGSRTFVITHDLNGVAKIGVTLENGPAGVTAPSQVPALAGQIT